jgi:hypothetical protein
MMESGAMTFVMGMEMRNRTLAITIQAFITKESRMAKEL